MQGEFKRVKDKKKKKSKRADNNKSQFTNYDKLNEDTFGDGALEDGGDWQANQQPLFPEERLASEVPFQDPAIMSGSATVSTQNRFGGAHGLFASDRSATEDLDAGIPQGYD